jgi:hypothetical protein
MKEIKSFCFFCTSAWGNDNIPCMDIVAAVFFYKNITQYFVFTDATQVSSCGWKLQSRG